MTWQLLRHAGRGELTEFRVDQREQLLGGLGVALLDTMECDCYGTYCGVDIREIEDTP